MKNTLKKLAPFLAICIVTQVAGGFSVTSALADLTMPDLTTTPPAQTPALTLAQIDAQNQINADNQQIAALTQKIAEYQAALNQAGADKKTLKSAIAMLDLQRSKVQAQVALTQSEINSTQTQIQELAAQISDKQKAIAQYKDALTKYLQDIYESEDQPLALRLVAAGKLSDFWQSLDQDVQVQNAVEQKTQQVKIEEADLVTAQAAVQKKQDDLSEQNKTLVSQQQSLSTAVLSKSQLLAATSSKESQYQKLLAQAKAQLASFSNFTKNAGGAKLLANQTSCDAWGCYYNQRDTAWGKNSLDGTSYTLASDGCLVTSMAMVMTHYGYRNVTPQTINANPNNFAAYYPAFLLNTISAGGATATRTAATIDAVLATGNPVVVGMNALGGTHFVVLVRGSNGSYTMRDPYVANGKDINFSSYYTLREIYSISKVTIGS